MNQNLSTIAFRANLLENLKELCFNTKDIIGRWEKLNAETSKISLENELLELMFSARLSGLVTAIETLLNDTLLNIYIAFPLKIGKKNLSIHDLISSGTYLQTIKAIAANSVNDLSYKSFREYWDEWQKFAVKVPTISEDEINAFSEMKATRDLYVHNNGKINDLYLRKAGEKARRPNNRDKIPLDETYIASASKLSEAFVSKIEQLLLKNYINCTKESVFREMWEATCCGKLVNFCLQWELTSSPYHRKDYKWSWSSSEKALFDVFLKIFHGKSELISTDLTYAPYRWSPESAEGKVIRSWIESPFYIYK